MQFNIFRSNWFDQNQIMILLVALLIVDIIILIIQDKRYYWWYPSFNFTIRGFSKSFPDSRTELRIAVTDYIMKRTPNDVAFFQLTDVTPAAAFTTIIKPEEMSLDEMNRIIQSSRIVFIVKSFKYLYNRARPAQLDPETINKKNGTLLDSETAATPAYPSGHAIQAYYLAKILAQKFPAKTQALMETATKCANVRIMVGLHYPSDRDFGFWVVDRYLLN
jgi:membrane-associated phospholipid phosphatase